MPPTDPTRRAVIAGTSAAAWVSGGATGVDPQGLDAAGALCARWLHLDAKISRLQDRWARLEDRLSRRHGWFQIPPAQRSGMFVSRLLQRIDARLDSLCERRDAVLQAMPAAGSTDLGVIIAKLTVVERLVWPHDHPEAHALIVGSVQDLLALSGKGAVRRRDV